MNNIIIILYTKDYIDLDGTICEVFLNRQYVGAIEKDTYVLKKILTAINSNVIIEEIDLDSYLNEEDRLNFALQGNFFFTETEEEAILKGEIDYAFDMIKARINN